MKTRNYFLLCLLLSTTLFMNSCSKDGDGKDKLEDQNVPQNRAEAEQQISGKWTLSGSGDVKSIEFTSNSTYVLEVSTESDLVPFAGINRQVSDFSSLKVKDSKLASIGPIGTLAVASTTRVSGTYTISSDGKTVNLDQIATITITDLTETNFSFSITFKEDNTTIDVKLAATAPVDSSSKTTLLARTWVLQAWSSEFDTEELAAIADKGFKPEDQRFTFTTSGTFIATTISIESSTSPTQPGSPAPPETHEAFLETEIGIWQWKDETQTAVVVTTIDGSDEWSISNLTASSVTIDGVTVTAK